MDNDRKLISLRDAAVILTILAVSAAAYLAAGYFSKGENRAVIICGGETIATVSLRQDGEYSFPETGNMVFTVREGGISVTESSCPDKICMRTGSISRAGEAIICVPNRTAVTVESCSEESGVDVVLR